MQVGGEKDDLRSQVAVSKPGANPIYRGVSGSGQPKGQDSTQPPWIDRSLSAAVLHHAIVAQSQSDEHHIRMMSDFVRFSHAKQSTPFFLKSYRTCSAKMKVTFGHTSMVPYDLFFAKNLTLYI
jgi:hypothetical protein